MNFVIQEELRFVFGLSSGFGYLVLGIVFVVVKICVYIDFINFFFCFKVKFEICGNVIIGNGDWKLKISVIYNLIIELFDLWFVVQSIYEVFLMDVNYVVIRSLFVIGM